MRADYCYYCYYRVVASSRGGEGSDHDELSKIPAILRCGGRPQAAVPKGTTWKSPHPDATRCMDSASRARDGSGDVSR